MHETQRIPEQPDELNERMHYRTPQRDRVCEVGDIELSNDQVLAANSRVQSDMHIKEPNMSALRGNAEETTNAHTPAPATRS